MTEKVKKERHRVPDEVIDFLAHRLGPQLGHPTHRKKALSPRDQVKALTFIKSEFNET